MASNIELNNTVMPVLLVLAILLLVLAINFKLQTTKQKKRSEKTSG